MWFDFFFGLLLGLILGAAGIWVAVQQMSNNVLARAKAEADRKRREKLLAIVLIVVGLSVLTCTAAYLYGRAVETERQMLRGYR